MRRLVCVCVMCGRLAATCFKEEAAKVSAEVHVLEFSLFCSAATQPPPRYPAWLKNTAECLSAIEGEGTGAGGVVSWQEISRSNISTHPFTHSCTLKHRLVLSSAGL